MTMEDDEDIAIKIQAKQIDHVSSFIGNKERVSHLIKSVSSPDATSESANVNTLSIKDYSTTADENQDASETSSQRRDIEYFDDKKEASSETVSYALLAFIQSSRKRICFSVWNQCSPSSITVRSAWCALAKAVIVLTEVRLSLLP